MSCGEDVEFSSDVYLSYVYLCSDNGVMCTANTLDDFSRIIMNSNSTQCEFMLQEDGPSMDMICACYISLSPDAFSNYNCYLVREDPVMLNGMQNYCENMYEESSMSDDGKYS